MNVVQVVGVLVSCLRQFSSSCFFTISGALVHKSTGVSHPAQVDGYKAVHTGLYGHVGLSHTV